jgi:hypothetical protein
MDEWRSPARGRIDLVPAARDTPDVDEIRNELGRIVASEALRNSLRLTRFITFVVETTLAGTDARIKAYTIAVEALGRAGNFDPQSDPIVRVEACRLRQALARYYAGAGRDDPLVIEVPRGTYVPSFRRRGAESCRPSAAVTRHHSHPGSSRESDRLAEIAAHGQQLSHLLAKLQELLHIQRMQVVAVVDAIASATQTLHHSRALLQSTVTTGVACSPSSRLTTRPPTQPGAMRTADDREIQEA